MELDPSRTFFWVKLGKTQIVWLLALWSRQALSPFLKSWKSINIYIFEALCPRQRIFHLDWLTQKCEVYPFFSSQVPALAFLQDRCFLCFYGIEPESTPLIVRRVTQIFYQVPSLQGWDTSCWTECSLMPRLARKKGGEAHFCSAGTSLFCNIVQGSAMHLWSLALSCLDLFRRWFQSIVLEIRHPMQAFQPRSSDEIDGTRKYIHQEYKTALLSPIIWGTEYFSSISFWPFFPSPSLQHVRGVFDHVTRSWTCTFPKHANRCMTVEGVCFHKKLLLYLKLSLFCINCSGTMGDWKLEPFECN